jgi:hypothetical protein
VSGNGYMKILKWNGKVVEPKWISPKYSYPLGFGDATFSRISGIVHASYLLNKQTITDYLYFGYTTAKSSDIYKVTWINNKYEPQKISASPFNWFDFGGTCGDGSSVIIGRKQNDKGNYVVYYKWNGSVLVENYQSALGTDIVVSGEILTKTSKAVNVLLVSDHGKKGLLTCNKDSVEWLQVDTDPGMVDLWRDNSIRPDKSIIGHTKKNSVGELWTIQGSGNEYEYKTKLYVSQFDGKRFAPFSRVNFRGIDSDMIFNMIITDVDNDGVGEIIGVEEKVRKSIPRNYPGDTGEEGDTLLITSNLFLAKWNGKEYEIKWHTKAVEERVARIAVGDIRGDGKNEILVTDNNGYLYIFEMPDYK